MGNRRVRFPGEQVDTSFDGLLRLGFCSTGFSLSAFRWTSHRSKPHKLRPVLLEGIMATASSHVIGQYVQLAGAGVFITGAILSLHHYAIGICFVAGAAAFYVGKKLRAA
jgi:hypothetical protein